MSPEQTRNIRRAESVLLRRIRARTKAQRELERATKRALIAFQVLDYARRA